MDLKQLQYFVISVNCGSFKKAAEVLYTTQPHISKTIKSLEAELKFDLLIRNSRGVEVTEAGKKVYEYACRMLTESEKIMDLQEVQDFRELRVASSPSEHFSTLFHKFYLSVSKRIHAQYMEGNLDEIFQAIHRHTAEIGILCVEQKQMTAFQQLLDYRRLEFFDLGKTEPLLFVGPKHPLYHATSIVNSDLKGLQFIQAKETQNLIDFHLMQGSEDYHYLKRHNQVLLTNSRQLIAQILLETELCNISCALFPETSVQNEIRGIPMKGMRDSMVFGYIKRKRDELSPEAKQFVKYISDRK